jgi:hypothetical protein
VLLRFKPPALRRRFVFWAVPGKAGKGSDFPSIFVFLDRPRRDRYKAMSNFPPRRFSRKGKHP